jgi:cholesterol oxidase
MGHTATGCVVSHSGEALGYRGLCVMDGSVVPRVLGLNPCKAMAALAERSADLMVNG